MTPASNAFSASKIASAALAAAALAAWWLIWSPAEVVTTRPQKGDAAEVVYATGTVEPENWAKVVSLHRKRIVEVCNCEGKRVRKGEVLARLDSIEERALLNELEARRDTIKADAERIAILLKRDVATQVSYDEKLTQLREYEARVSAQKDRLLDLDLEAPMDGVILKSDATVGEIAGTGVEDVLFWVGEPKPLEISAEVNEEDIAKVKIGQTALLRHDGFAGQKLTATVSHLTPKGDPRTKTFNVDLALPSDSPLQIGMSVEANIVIKEAIGVLLLPAEAIHEGHVLIVRNGRIERVAVETGIRGGRLVEIRSGLDATASVVLPGNLGLSEGTAVRQKSGATP
jgi:RND family efflux transporter MFP subunit